MLICFPRVVYPAHSAILNHCSVLPRCAQNFLFSFFPCDSYSISLNRAGITHLVGLGNYPQDYMLFLCLGINRLPRKWQTLLLPELPYHSTKSAAALVFLRLKSVYHQNLIHLASTVLFVRKNSYLHIKYSSFKLDTNLRRFTFKTNNFPGVKVFIAMYSWISFSSFKDSFNLLSYHVPNGDSSFVPEALRALHKLMIHIDSNEKS